MKNIKLAFIVGSLGSGGAERVCALLSNFFVDNNIDVTIYIKKSNEACIYELDKRIVIKVIDYPRAGKNKLSLLRSGALFISRLRDQLKSDNPDVIVSFGVGLNILTIPIAKSLHKPVIVSEHMHYLDPIRIFKIARRCLYRYAYTVTVLTRYDYDYYKRFLRNVMVMHNPVILQGNSNSSPVKEPFVLGAGTMSLYVKKGFDRLIEMFPYQSNWQLRLAGRGDNSVLKKICSDKNIEDRVEFMGEVKDMNTLYDRTSIFALSSRSEGLPMVLLEAMSHGCACVSFDIVSGPSEIITDGIDGFLVEDNDMATFSSRLMELMDNQELREKLGKGACEKVKMFSIERIGHKWLQLIDKTVKIK